MRRGRAGRAPNLSINNNRGVTRQEVGPLYGRAHALSNLVPGLGGFLSWRGKGRGLSLPTPTTPPSTPPQPLDRGFPLPSPPTSPPPLEDCSPPMRCQEAPLRQPHTMSHCLQPHGRFPPQPPMLCMTQMSPMI